MTGHTEEVRHSIRNRWCYKSELQKEAAASIYYTLAWN
jgi:hypothetical protein